ncbi:PemK-like protein [Candidatus Moduliflexus flocculans]|uniref:mRNA interferase n=1 Tax=Candidatus Moduliflexus flocculans TaxID=1499966 RepID=A0A0S6VT39_9BACT|nr:PemK-like protein [Candidatus Moduliflexus flocculans]
MAMQRGDIYFVNLASDHSPDLSNVRPVLVLSINAVNRLPLVVTVVVGAYADRISRNFQATVRLSAEETGLDMDTVYLAFQLRSLSHYRFPANPAGRATEDAIQRVENAVRYCLGL